jgi:hypothetical protein
MAAPDPVNNPPHYNSHPSGVECIEITRHMSFNLGNVVKYLWRAGLKDQAPTVQDLKKAAWYLNDEIKRLGGDEPSPAKKMCDCNQGRLPCTCQDQDARTIV